MPTLIRTMTILLALGLAGCGGQVTWTNPSLTDEQQRLQFYQCKKDGRELLAHGSRNLMLAIDATTECLTAHGFTRSVS